MKAACIQINSSNDMAANLAKAEKFVREAAAENAELILLPENFAFMPERGKELHENSFHADDHPAIKQFCELAVELKVWILLGSLSVHSHVKEKLFNRSFLINAKGEVVEHYDKIHLYDVDVPSGESHYESRNYAHGEKIKIAKTPWGNLGMTVCYDLRFPHLFRSLAQKGADFIAVPSAFTKFTGQAHWHTLLAARAIENGCYILAPAQVGKHPRERETFGHSLIIDPWGEVLGDAGEEEGLIIAELSKEKVAETRKNLPSLYHDREFN